MLNFIFSFPSTPKTVVWLFFQNYELKSLISVAVQLYVKISAYMLGLKYVFLIQLQCCNNIYYSHIISISKVLPWLSIVIFGFLWVELESLRYMTRVHNSVISLEIWLLVLFGVIQSLTRGTRRSVNTVIFLYGAKNCRFVFLTYTKFHLNKKFWVCT